MIVHDDDDEAAIHIHFMAKAEEGERKNVNALSKEHGSAYFVWKWMFLHFLGSNSKDFTFYISDCAQFSTSEEEEKHCKETIHAVAMN